MASLSSMADTALMSMTGAGQHQQAAQLAPALSTAQQAFLLCGLTTPFSRFIFGYTITETLMLLTKPSFCFDGQGRSKNFALWGGKSIKNDTTMLPWYLPGIVVGGVMALFF